MSDRRVVLNLAGEHKLARDLVAGGVFVPGYDLALNEDCELVLRGTDASELRLAAKVVWAGNGGIGLQLENCDAEMKQRIGALAGLAPESTAPVENARPIRAAVTHSAPGNDASGNDASGNDARGDDAPGNDAPGNAADADDADDAHGASDAAGADPEAADDDGPKKPQSMHERIRHLSLAQQIKLAAHGELAERTLLERTYGKNVWEALLRNPRVTGPEVARIARMGSLPRPLMEIILNNGGWLQIPEVRRALLTNPRLGTDQILRILRLLPKHEIKMAATQTIYPLAVRDAAKRLMREAAGG